MILENLKTLFLTAVPSSPAFYVAMESPSRNSVLVTIILPIVFFAIGKTVDVCLQIHFRRQEAKRQDANRKFASNSNNSKTREEKQLR